MVSYKFTVYNFSILTVTSLILVALTKISTKVCLTFINNNVFEIYNSIILEFSKRHFIRVLELLFSGASFKGCFSYIPPIFYLANLMIIEFHVMQLNAVAELENYTQYCLCATFLRSNIM